MRVKAIIVIPARYASSRLPGKPLLCETGRPLIQHVCEQAGRSQRAGAVIVATDDGRIAQAVTDFGGQAAMTRGDHPSGTDRVAEVAAGLDADVVVNVQGDEPEIAPEAIDLAIDLLADDPDAMMSTLATPIRDSEQWQDAACVKVVVDEAGRALYFSRSPIPHHRDAPPAFGSPDCPCYQHLGLYAYRRDFLLEVAGWPPAKLEQAEKLEQLRVLARGYTIRVGIVDEPAIGIDTPEDYARFVQRYGGKA